MKIYMVSLFHRATINNLMFTYTPYFRKAKLYYAILLANQLANQLASWFASTN